MAGAELPEPEDADDDEVLDAEDELLDESEEVDDVDELSLFAVEPELLLLLLDFDESRLSLR